MKSWVKKMLKSRKEFYKKYPEKEKARLEKIRKTGRSAKERKEMSVKMKQVYKGKSTQKLMYKNHPELREKLSRIKKRQYASNPKLRRKTSRAMKKFYAKNPQVSRLIAKKLKERYKNHPYLKERISEEKQLYYEKNPEARKHLLEYFSKPHKKIKAMNNLIVKSQGEKIIADTLIKNSINPNYEAHELNFPEMDPIPDFYPDSLNIFIEFYGGHPKSWKTKVEKNILYKKYKIPILALTPAELKDINFENNLLREMKKLSQSQISKNFNVKKSTGMSSRMIENSRNLF